MSRALATLARARGTEKRDQLPPDERRALEKTRIEAKRAGATLKDVGGGLRPSLALGIFRRDEWRCKKCGGRKKLGIHHKGHLENPVSRWLRSKGRSNAMNALVVTCAKCHDDIHEEDRDG